MRSNQLNAFEGNPGCGAMTYSDFTRGLAMSPRDPLCSVGELHITIFPGILGTWLAKDKSAIIGVKIVSQSLEHSSAHFRVLGYIFSTYCVWANPAPTGNQHSRVSEFLNLSHFRLGPF